MDKEIEVITCALADAANIGLTTRRAPWMLIVLPPDFGGGSAEISIKTNLSSKSAKVLLAKLATTPMLTLQDTSGHEN